MSALQHPAYRTGLGLDAQRTAVKEYLAGWRWRLISEYTEVESGMRNDRPQLAKALHHSKVTGARLVIAKLDRLLRNAAFLLTLRGSGVRFVVADVPDANELTIGVLALVAQHERECISARTKAALAEAKKRGVKLGNPNGARPLHGNAPAVAAVRAQVETFAEMLRPIIEDIEAAGITSNRGIAQELIRREIRAARGSVEGWTATTVARVRARLVARRS